MAHALGDVVLVTHTPRFRLPSDGWADLDLAIIAEAEGDLAGAQALIRRLEARLGVTERDRYVAAHGRPPETAGNASVRASRRKRKEAERSLRHALRAHDIRDQAKPTAKQLEALAESEAAVTVANAALRDLVERPLPFKEARRIRAEANAALAKAKVTRNKITAALIASTERNYQARIAAEREELAARRQEELVTETVEAKVMVRLAPEGVLADVYVPREQRVTRVRNVTRDGLETLYTAGAINQVQRAAGIRYRRIFEELAEDLGSCMGDPGRVRGVKNDLAAIERALARKRLAAYLAGMEARVKRDAKRADLAIPALRDIAGRGRNLMEMASSGSRRTALRDALIDALDILADAWGIH